MKTAAAVSRFRNTHPASPTRLPASLFVLLLFSLLSNLQPARASGSHSSPSHGPLVTTNKIVLSQTPSAHLSRDRSSYIAGQPVLLTFKVTNTSKKPIRYEFPSGQQAAFSVTDSKGNNVWDSSPEKGTFRGITHLILTPGQSHTYSAKWNERDNRQRPLPPGVYTATAYLVPMPREEVSGGIIVNTDPDPENTGMPTKGKVERGAILQQDTTPQISARVQITIRAAKP